MDETIPNTTPPISLDHPLIVTAKAHYKGASRVVSILKYLGPVSLLAQLVVICFLPRAGLGILPYALRGAKAELARLFVNLLGHGYDFSFHFLGVTTLVALPC